jgi:hypothetical protein
MAIKLTAERVKRALPKAGSTRVLRDSEAKGLLPRVRPSGSRTFAFQYRAGKGRTAPQRIVTIGNAQDVSLSEAREFALRYAAQVRAGGDPAQQKKAADLDQRMRLSVALNAYEASLRARKVVNVRSIMSALRRQALSKLGEDRRLAGGRVEDPPGRCSGVSEGLGGPGSGARREALDLFGVHAEAPHARLDGMGLVPLLGGHPVVALTEDSAAIGAESGGTLTFHRPMEWPQGRCLICEL